MDLGVGVHHNAIRIAHQFVNGDANEKLREACGDDESCHLPESKSVFVESSSEE